VPAHAKESLKAQGIDLDKFQPIAIVPPTVAAD
jgi:hypothetical protein